MSYHARASQVIASAMSCLLEKASACHCRYGHLTNDRASFKEAAKPYRLPRSKATASVALCVLNLQEPHMTLSSTVPDNWYQSFFTAPINAFWEACVPAAATEQEVAFIERHLQLDQPARILDIPCGAGRHSLALARRGHRITGVDISEDAVIRLRALASPDNLPLEVIHQDMGRLALDGCFDGAICFGNSFGYLAHEKTLAYVRKLHTLLRHQGRFIIDTGMIAEAILAETEPESTYEINGYTFAVRNEYEPRTGRMNVHTVLSRGTDRWQQSFSQAVYTCAELIRLLEENGFAFVGMFADTNDAPFARGQSRLLLVVQRS
jgi:SAM-dependent methyltransferase